MLALVPLRQFRELAFVMGLGVLIDALVVRAVMVPALLALLGGFSAWPRKLRGADVPLTRRGDVQPIRRPADERPSGGAHWPEESSPGGPA
jgi:RND superfamily putative drug exporter